MEFEVRSNSLQCVDSMCMCVQQSDARAEHEHEDGEQSNLGDFHRCILIKLQRSSPRRPRDVISTGYDF